MDTKFGALKLWQAALFFLVILLVYSLLSYMIANSPARRSSTANLPANTSTNGGSTSNADQPTGDEPMV